MKTILNNLKAYNTQLTEDRIYVHFDKTLYEAGETIWFTAYVLDGQTLKKSTQSAWITMELRDPKGNVEQTHKIILVDGVAKGDFYIKKHWVGGQYQVRAVTNWIKNDENPAVFVKNITVQQTILPRLKMKLTFEKKAYGRGDEVVAKLQIKDNANEPLQNFPFNYDVSLKGQKYKRKPYETDNSGNATFRFLLKDDLSTTDCLVNVMINYQGQTESISRAVPIVLNNIEMGFYPESGDLINNLLSNVAFKAVNEHGKPADVEGIIRNKKGKIITTFSSFHDGMGSFELLPKTGEYYQAEITQPKGITTVYDLPMVLESGHTLLVEEVTEDFMTLSVQSTIQETIHIVGNIRGKNYFVESFDTLYSSKKITINIKDFPIGVLHLTLFDSQEMECAERLVFVNTHRQLNIDISTDKTQYQPREKVTMTLKVTDSNDKPIQSNLSLSVVDDQLLNYIDDDSSHILSWLLLENDISTKVDNPTFYFDKNEPKAKKARDFLLMTAGWRRFTWKQIRSGELPEIKHKKDEKIVSGKIFSYRQNWVSKPLRKAKVQIGNKVTWTKKDGSFTFKDVDIKENSKIKITKWRHQEGEYSISNYTDNYEMSIYKKTPIVRLIFDWILIFFRVIIWLILDLPLSLILRREIDVFNSSAWPWSWSNSSMNAITYSAGNIDCVVDDKVKISQPTQTVTQYLSQNIDTEQEIEVDNFSYDYGFYNSNKNDDNRFYWGREFPKQLYEEKKTVKKRTDFRSTVYWNGKVTLDKKGEGVVEFYNSDLITSFRITCEGISKNGLIGRTTQQYFTQLPFSLSTKLPHQLVVGDLVKIPLTLVNNTTATITGQVSVKTPNGLLPKGKLLDSITLEGKTGTTEFLAFEVVKKGKKDKLSVEFVSEGLSDSMEQDLEIVNYGFPVNISFASFKSAEIFHRNFIFSMDNIIKHSVTARLQVDRGILYNLTAGLKGLIRQPYGCFEQTSSITYPNILILQLFQLIPDVADENTIKAAKYHIKAGYERLLRYECKGGGFEWFGRGEGHGGLTAYGIMEFTEMKAVYDGVSQKMIDRTTKWLLGLRDGNGLYIYNKSGFIGKSKNVEEATKSLYITWALSEAKIEGLDIEMNFAYQKAMKTQNPYYLSLAANTMFNYGELEKGENLVKNLLRLQETSGKWTLNNNFVSMPGSRGLTLDLETAALAALAIMKSRNKQHPKLKRCFDYLKSSQNSWGNFGSTSSTVLVLKAFLEFSKEINDYSKNTGVVEIAVNQEVIKYTEFDSATHYEVVNSDFASVLQQGKNELSIKFSKTEMALSYNIGIDYLTSLPPKSPDCEIQLTMQLNETQIRLGETVRLSILIKNKANRQQAMTTAIIGLPSGLSLQPWQLKQGLDENKFDFYELMGNRLILYYRTMNANDIKRIDLDLKADIAGCYQSPASCAYLYYMDEFKDWTILEEVEILE
ncbi:MAG: MG2 domain-containing protein [Saprospiraceae bacterium]